MNELFYENDCQLSQLLREYDNNLIDDIDGLSTTIVLTMSLDTISNYQDVVLVVVTRLMHYYDIENITIETLREGQIGRNFKFKSTLITELNDDSF